MYCQTPNRSPAAAQPVSTDALPDDIDARYVVARLEEAGTTMLCLPHMGPTTKLRSVRYDVVHTAIDACGWQAAEARVRPSVPGAAAVSRMDEALGWIGLIPQDKYVLRRILGARALVGPLTGRHLYPWRRLAGLLGADHKAIQRWHGQGVAMIVAALQPQSQKCAIRR
jgi:hypothetical protein